MAEHGVEIPSAQSAIQATETLFAPALKDRNDQRHIIQKLAAPRAVDDDLRIEFLGQAGDLLRSLHGAVKFEQTSRPQGQAYDSSLLLALYKLTDFLLLDGVYPSLPPGVGQLTQLRNKSLFYSKPDSHYVCLKGSDQSALVLSNILAPILKDVDAGVEPLIRHRALNHIIVGNAWLAYCEKQSPFTTSFSSYLDRLPTSALLASYTALLRGSEVDWFRSVVSEQLSTLPLRQNGVRSTIDFIAASHRPPQQEQQQSDGSVTEPSSGPPLPLDALQQVSRLLSSVPRTMSAELYLTQLAPQLFALLDDRNEPALQKAVAFIIGNGILGKRSLGAPGSTGWAIFAEPILHAINPLNSASSNKRKADSVVQGSLNDFVVSQTELQHALRRLAALVLSYPNPGLTGRLIRPLLLPLWALSKYRGLSFSATEVSKTGFSLITQFLSLVGTSQNVCLLADNLLWNGAKEWVFGPGEAGGIAVRKRATSLQHSEIGANIEKEFAQVDEAVHAFCNLVTSSKVSDGDLSALFHHVFIRNGGATNHSTSQANMNENILATLAKGKLAEALVTTFADRLMHSPEQVLDLVDHIIQRHGRTAPSRKLDSSSPSLANLSHIAQSPQAIQDEPESSNDDILLIALSLLNAFAVSPELAEGPVLSAKVKETLKLLNQLSLVKNEDEALPAQIKTTIALLEAKISQSTSSAAQADTDAVFDVQRTLSLISVDIASELPPIRRSALHALQAMIKSPDAPLDVPPIGLILLEVLRTEKEEFVYLAAVQTTVQLAISRNLGLVTRLLVDSFQDAEEQTGIDGRLRIGEVLSGIVDAVAEADAKTLKREEIVRSMAKSFLEVAGRRGQRRRELLERQRVERLQRRKRKEAERAWGGEVPELPIETGDDEIETLSPAEQRLRLQNLDAIDSIVKGWQDTGYEEDVRIRASSLSILGRLFEQLSQEMQGTTMVSNSIDLSLSILSLELEPAKAILRRAAVMTLFGMLKGIDSQIELGEVSGIQPLMSGGDWAKVETILKWVVDTDPDDLTVGHSQSVLDGLEAVRMKLVAAASEYAAQSPSVNDRLEGIALTPDIKPKQAANPSASRRPIIEELE